MVTRTTLILTFGILILISSPRLIASPVLSLSDLRISGFMSAVGSVSDLEAPYHRSAKITDDYDFGRETMLGLQIDANLSDKLAFTTQLLADRQPDNYSLQADWIYAKYSFNKMLNIKFGRLRIPNFMFSDFIEVAMTYSWIRPPAEVYGMIPLNAYNGIDLTMKIPILDYNLQIQAMMGNSELDTTLLSVSGNATISAYESAGINFTLTTDYHLFRFGYLTSKIDIFDNGVELFQQFNAAGIFSLVDPLLIDEAKMNFIEIGSDLHFGRLTAVMEHALRQVRDSILKSEQSGTYVMLQYSFDRLHPHVTYAISNSTENTILNAEQSSVTVGIKYTLTQNAVIKVDYIHIKLLNGTRGFFLTQPANKDNANIISVALDLVF